MLKALPATLVWSIGEAPLLMAARLKAGYRIALADAIIAGYAQDTGVILLHQDPEFDRLTGLVQLKALPYKHG